jgi:hypothetical protein
MRIVVLIFALASTLGFYGCTHTNAGTAATSTLSATGSGATKSSPATNSSALEATASSPGKPATVGSAKVDFQSQIRPILEAKCQPCHFSGGKVYEKMPFDRAETIKTLGTKLFTRIKDENERHLIRDFLANE